MGEHQDHGDPLCRGCLDPGEPAKERESVEALGVTDHKVEGRGAVEAGVDDAVARVPAEIPEINGDLFGLEGKEIGSFVSPFRHLKSVCVLVGVGEK